jgi:hypothetical protein
VERRERLVVARCVAIHRAVEGGFVRIT